MSDQKNLFTMTKNDSGHFLNSVKIWLVGPVRFELTTPRLSSVCSNQLSYEPIARYTRQPPMVEPDGIEPTTSSLQS